LSGFFIDVIKGTSIITLELLAGLLGIAIFLFALLCWRLSTGPMSLTFAKPYIERAISLEESGIVVKIEETMLVWVDWDHAFDIRIYNATVLGHSGKILASLPEVSVGFSIAALFRGLIAPNRLEVQGLSAIVERDRDGRFVLGLFASSDSVADQEFVNRIPEYVSLLSKPGDPSSVFGYLDSVQILDVDIRYLDELNGGEWHSLDSDIELLRGDEGMEAIASMKLNFGDGSTQLRAHAIFAPERPVIDIGIEFDRLIPSEFAARITPLRQLEKLNLPLSGQLRVLAQHSGTINSIAFDVKVAGGSVAGNIILEADQDYEMTMNIAGLQTKLLMNMVPQVVSMGELDTLLQAQISGRIGPKGQVRRLKIETRAGAGMFRIGKVFPDLIKFEGFAFQAKIRDGFDGVSIKSGSIDFGGAELVFEISASRIGDTMRARINADLRTFELSELERYWPVNLGASARQWTTRNIRTGKVDEGKLGLVLESPVEDPLSPKIRSISGTLEYSGLDFSYFDAFPKMTGVAGTATFSGDRFDLNILRGNLQDIALDHGVVHITQLDTDREQVAIDLVFRGPLATVLGVVNRKPLNFLGEIGINPAMVGGDIAARLGLQFPLRDDVQLSDMRVSAAANMQRVRMKPGPLGFVVANSDLELKLSNTTMKVAGQMELNGVPLSLDWHKNFSTGQGFRSRYILSGDLDVDALERLGLPKLPFIGGVSETNLILTRFGDERSEVLVSGNLNGAVISIPHIGWLKPAGRPGNFRMGLMIAADGAFQVDNLSVTADDLEIVGKVGLGGVAGQKWRADFAKFKFSKTNIAGSVVQLSNGGYHVQVDRGTLDLEPVLYGDSLEARETDAESAMEYPAISFDVNLNTLRTGQQRRFGPTIVKAKFANGGLNMLALEASLPNDKMLRARYEPGGAGHKLEVQSNDAGQALLTLGWSDKLEGGDLAINGQRKTPSEPLRGSFALSKFKLSRAPALARLLQVASLTGIFDALQRGLDFTSFDGTFGYQDGILRLNRSRAYGSSIGITMEGSLDLDEDIAGLKGTVVPAYTVNRVLGQIPILGPILTGGKDEGVFAATYGVSGPLEDPVISVNTLSALAPGFLRHLFDVIGGGGDTKNSPISDADPTRR
jgi:hypothetical protein